LEPTATRVSPEGRTLIGLFSDLWRETTRLIHAEAELAKAEMSEKVSEFQNGLVAMAIGGAVLFAGFIVLLIAASAGLYFVLRSDTEHAIWLAPMIVGLTVVVAGAIGVAKGRSDMKSSNLAPERTMRSLRRDAQLVKEHIR
jgi:hypothetical protein